MRLRARYQKKKKTTVESLGLPTVRVTGIERRGCVVSSTTIEVCVNPKTPFASSLMMTSKDALSAAVLSSMSTEMADKVTEKPSVTSGRRSSTMAA